MVSPLVRAWDSFCSLRALARRARLTALFLRRFRLGSGWETKQIVFRPTLALVSMGAAIRRRVSLTRPAAGPSPPLSTVATADWGADFLRAFPKTKSPGFKHPGRAVHTILCAVAAGRLRPWNT